MGLAMATSRPRDRINFEHDGKTLLFLYIHVQRQCAIQQAIITFPMCVKLIFSFFFFSKTKSRRGYRTFVIERCSHFLETSELN